MSHAATHCDDSPGCSGPSTCTRGARREVHQAVQNDTLQRVIKRRSRESRAGRGVLERSAWREPSLCCSRCRSEASAMRQGNQGVSHKAA
jgi:hypothetical protein